MPKKKKVQNKGGKSEKIEKGKEIKKDNYDVQIKIAIIIMIVIIGSIFAVQWAVQRSRTFEFWSMKFYIDKSGPVTYYSTALNYVYKDKVLPFVFKLRDNPKEVSKIPFEDEVTLKKEVFLATSPNMSECDDTRITLPDFAINLKAFGGINTKLATTDAEYGKEHSLPVVGCKDAVNKTIILIQEGNETKITKNKDCYTIEVKDCQIQIAFERFVLAIVDRLRQIGLIVPEK